MTRHKLNPAEERRAKTNSVCRGGFIAVVRFAGFTNRRGRLVNVRGIRSELVTTEGAARKAAEDLKARTWHTGRNLLTVKEACYFRVNALGDSDMTFEPVQV